MEVLVNVVESLVANGFTALIGYGIGKVREMGLKRKKRLESLTEDNNLVSSIQNVIKEIEGSLFPSETQSKIAQFLESPTAENIVRQIYSDFLDLNSKGKGIKMIQEEFIVNLALYLKYDPVEIHQIASDLFDAIKIGCDKALNLSIENGKLSAHEAKSIERYRVVLDGIHSIKNNLDFLKNHMNLDLDAVNDFETKYRSQIDQRYNKVTIPSFDRVPRVEIDKIFVAPKFIHETKGAEPKEISFETFLTHLHRTVVLGDPGGGKSTLSQQICHDLSKNYEKRPIGGRLLTPVLVVLREYSSKKNEEGVSIVEFMEREVTSKYQLSKKPPSGAFEYLLNNGHLFVIFDGLDELVDPSHRREISKDIESFCNLFSSVPALVTSRIVGYEQAPLSPDTFETYKITPFNEEQVFDYVKKWFDNDSTLTPDEKKSKINSFMKESSIVSDLRSNPLMLALMCTLYKGAGFIPRNRTQVYEKCSEMLLERWDPSRGVWVPLSIPEPRFLISYLANWIYSDESLQSGVPENLLIKKSTEFLLNRTFETVEEAEKASKEFLEFCKGRAWVFTDVGTTSKGIPIYKFTHKTFLEYFTANYIIRNYNTPERLWDLLSPKIAERSWDEVSQLAIQMLYENVENASDTILKYLIRDSEKAMETRWRYLPFGARCLQFVYPSPEIVRSLTKASVKCLVEGYQNLGIKKATKGHTIEFESEELIESLLVAYETHPKIIEYLENEILYYSKSEDDNIILRTIDLAYFLPLFLKFKFRRGYRKEFLDNLDKLRERILSQTEQKLNKLSKNNFLAFITYMRYLHNLSIDKLFKWYSPDYLLLEQPHIISKNIHELSIACEILLDFLRSDASEDEKISENFKRSIEFAAKIGKILLNTQLPCFSYNVVKDGIFRIYIAVESSTLRNSKFTNHRRSDIPMFSDAVVGVWCILAAASEIKIKEFQDNFVKNLEKSQNQVIRSLSYVIKARYQKTVPAEALEKIKEFVPSQEELNFIEKWIVGKTSFVKNSSRKVKYLTFRTTIP